MCAPYLAIIPQENKLGKKEKGEDFHYSLRKAKFQLNSLELQGKTKDKWTYLMSRSTVN